MTITPATGRYRNIETDAIVHAVHVDARDLGALATWVGGDIEDGPSPAVVWDNGTEWTAQPGDWILRAEDGSYSALSDAAFQADYTVAFT